MTKVVVPTPLKKKFEKKSKASRAAIAACLTQLRQDWRHPGLRSHKIHGRSVNGNPVFAARLTEGDRVTFYWHGEAIIVENHCTHKQVLGA